MKIDLTVSSLSALEKKLRASAKKIRSTPDNIIEKLLDVGEREAENNILTGASADGNTDIYIDRVEIRNAGKLSAVGDDVAYQEFGYGLVGHSNRNPKQPPEYQQGDRDKWVYVDGEGDAHWSHGMQAQMPMYKASRAMREALPDIAKNAVIEAVRGLK